MTIKRLRKIHVDQFYSFLKHAGKVSKVLVIKGDHDDDFSGDYQSPRINAISGCREMSGKTCTLERLVFLGLGFEQAFSRRVLRAYIADLGGRIGIVIAHAPQRNMRLLAELKPGLIVRGHYGDGKYMIDGVPAVFTSQHYAVIEIGKKAIPRIAQYPLKALFWDMSRDYTWLRKYPTGAAARRLP